MGGMATPKNRSHKKKPAPAATQEPGATPQQTHNRPGANTGARRPQATGGQFVSKLGAMQAEANAIPEGLLLLVTLSAAAQFRAMRYWAEAVGMEVRMIPKGQQQQQQQAFAASANTTWPEPAAEGHERTHPTETGSGSTYAAPGTGALIGTEG